MSKAPHTIFLQLYDSHPEIPDDELGITWCIDEVAEDPAYDVKYHRADDVEDTFNFVVQQLMAVREYIHLNAGDAGHNDNARGCTHPSCSAIRSALARAFGFVGLVELDADNLIWASPFSKDGTVKMHFIDDDGIPYPVKSPEWTVEKMKRFIMTWIETWNPEEFEGDNYLGMFIRLSMLNSAMNTFAKELGLVDGDQTVSSQSES